MTTYVAIDTDELLSDSNQFDAIDTDGLLSNQSDEEQDEELNTLIDSKPKASTINPRGYYCIIFCCFLLVTILASIIVWGSFKLNESWNQGVNQTFEQVDRTYTNHQRWARVLDKLHRGENITIGSLGGSITQIADGYCKIVGELLQTAFPINASLFNASLGIPRHQVLNRGKGGMKSDVASLCIANSFADVQPDIVTMEFAVNDALTDTVYAAMMPDENDKIAAFDPQDNIERLARSFLSKADGPALILLLMTTMYGTSASEGHIVAANHYGIPIIDWWDEYLHDWRMIDHAYNQSYNIETIYLRDKVHPTPEGHRVMAQLIIKHIQEMQQSYQRSNRTELLSSTLSRPYHPATPLLDKPDEVLPEPMNRAVLWTSKAQSYCRTTWENFVKDSNWEGNSTALNSSGMHLRWKSHDEPKPSFRPIDINAVGQWVRFRPPVLFEHAAVLIIQRSWNTSWANGTAYLSSSTAGPECNTKPIHVQGTWSNKNTQVAAIAVWSVPELIKDSCIHDTMTVTKSTPGDFQVVGYYAN